MALEEFEYPSPRKLDESSSIYIRIPSSIILDDEVNEKRITAFSFFYIKRALDSTVWFSINRIVEWTKRKPNRHKNGLNDKFAKAINYLANNEYISLYDKPSNTICTEAKFNHSKVSNECDHERFAVIYLDEIEKIMNYRDNNAKDSFMNNDMIMLIFAYLRMMIYRRSNKLRLEEINIDNKNSIEYDIETRKLRSPDTFNGYYCDIADDLGISDRIVSSAVNALHDLKLIYFEQLPRVRHDGKWRTKHTIFCNTYKRERDELLISGSEYYLSEVKRKKRKMKKDGYI